MQQPDPVIHQPVRLKIMAALRALPPGERIEFVRLRTIIQATEGNLGAHIGTLEGAAYVKVEKDFHARKPRTRVSLTHVGRRAFEQYVGFLRGILDPDGSLVLSAAAEELTAAASAVFLDRTGSGRHNDAQSAGRRARALCYGPRVVTQTQSRL